MEARSKLHYPMTRLTRTLGYHRHFLLVVSILIVVMTWPTILYVFKTDVFWLPTGRGDLFMKFWDAWYGASVFTGNAEFYFTDRLFYPDGLSLVYHNFSVPHMFVFRALQAVLPAANAYNLCYLLIIFATALSAYVYLLYLFSDKWVSLFGALVVGMSGYVVGRTSQPDVALIATLPLSLYFYHRSVVETRWRSAIVSAFIGMYTFVCILLSLGLYILYFARSHWRDRAYWLRIVLLLAVAAGISIWRIYPLIEESSALDAALDKSSEREQGNDLLQYFINYENPIYNRLITNRITSSFVTLPTPGPWSTSYLGYIPLLLIGFGLIRYTYRRRMGPWIALILPFLLLRLGSVLTINTVQVSTIFLPKHYLDNLIPAVFQAFHATDHFQTGILLPLAVLSCYGLQATLAAIPERKRALLILALIGLLAIEYYRTLDPAIVTEEETAFLVWFDGQDEGPIRLINLPMGRGNSKFYGFYQTLSGFPHVEGLASRTPPEAYSYIESNLLLETWRRDTSILCTADNRSDYLAAVDQLLEDGFSHLVLHIARLKPYTVQRSFVNLSPAYEDDYAAIYMLDDLPASCN